MAFTEVDRGPVKQTLSGFMDAAFVDALFALMEATVDKPATISPAVQQLTCSSIPAPRRRQRC